MNKIDGCGYRYPENSRPREPGGHVGYWLGRASRYISYYFAHDHYAWSLISASTNMSGVGGKLSTTVRGRLEGAVKELKNGFLYAAKKKQGNQANWQLAASPMEKFSLAKQITRKEIQLDNMIGTLVQGELKLAGSPVLWLDGIHGDLKQLYGQIAEMRERLAAEKAESDNGTQRVLADERRQSAPDQTLPHDDALSSHPGSDDEHLGKMKFVLPTSNVELGRVGVTMRRTLIDKDMRLREFAAFCKQIRNMYGNPENLSAEDYAVLAKVKEVLDVIPGDGDDRALKAKLQSWHTASLAGVAAKVEALRALVREPEAESPEVPALDPSMVNTLFGNASAEILKIRKLFVVADALPRSEANVAKQTLLKLTLRHLKEKLDLLKEAKCLELGKAFEGMPADAAVADLEKFLHLLDDNSPFDEIADEITIAEKEWDAVVKTMAKDRDSRIDPNVAATERAIFNEARKKREKCETELGSLHFNFVRELLIGCIDSLGNNPSIRGEQMQECKGLNVIAQRLHKTVMYYYALPKPEKKDGLEKKFRTVYDGAYNAIKKELIDLETRGSSDVLPDTEVTHLGEFDGFLSQLIEATKWGDPDETENWSALQTRVRALQNRIRQMKPRDVSTSMLSDMDPGLNLLLQRLPPGSQTFSLRDSGRSSVATDLPVPITRPVGASYGQKNSDQTVTSIVSARDTAARG